MSEQFESLKRAFAKQIKQHGYTKTTEDLKKHYEKLKQALREARHEVSLENQRNYERAYYMNHSAEINAKRQKTRLSWNEEKKEQYRSKCRTYYHEVAKKRRQKDRIEQLEAKLKELKGSEGE